MVVVPSDSSLHQELQALSRQLYGCLDKGGEVGPTIEEYNRVRDKKWCQAYVLLDMYGLDVNKVGWAKLLNSFGLLAPTRQDVQRAAWQRKVVRLPSPWVHEDDSYPTLVGYWTEHETCWVFHIR